MPTRLLCVCEGVCVCCRFHVADTTGHNEPANACLPVCLPSNGLMRRDCVCVLFYTQLTALIDRDPECVFPLTPYPVECLG